MANPRMPISSNGEMIPVMGRRALAVTVDATVSTATDVTLQSLTALVRIHAMTKGIYVRGQATASASAWDWFCPANQSIDIVVPSGVTVMSFIEESTTAKLIAAEYD